MKLEKLTEQQKSRLSEIKKEYIKKALSHANIDKAKSISCINFVYSLIKKSPPRIYSTVSPMAAQQLANKLKGTEKKYYSFGTYLSVYYQSFYAFYDSFVEFGIITEDKFQKYFKIRDYVDSGIFMTIEFENAIILCEKPVKCLKNDNGLHNTSGYAIEWRDGYGLYFINGRSIKKSIFERAASGKLTKEDYINETNDEVRSAWYEILGGEKLMQLLNASLVDETSVIHKNGEVETISIYRTKEKLNKIKKEPYAWIKRICPSTGTTYLTPTDPKFNKAIDAAKFHRPEWVPNKIGYSWYSRS